MHINCNTSSDAITPIIQYSQEISALLAALPRKTATFANLPPALQKTLLDVPVEVTVGNVIPRLSIRDQGRFAQTNLALHSLLKEGLRERAIKQLLTYIVRGELAPTLQMLETDPSLLLARGTVTDYSGRSIVNVTPFQAAWGGDDDDMCEEMLRFFDALPAQEGVEPTVSPTAAAAAPEIKTATQTGIAIAAAQIAKRFPEGVDNVGSYIEEYFNRLITDLIATNVAQYLNEDAHKAAQDAILDQFRAAFDASQLGAPITQGKHFNMQILINALTAYNKRFGDFLDWDLRDVFLVQVFGYTERFMTAPYAQAVAQGLYGIVENKAPLERSMEFKYDKGTFIFPLRAGVGLGSNFIAGGTGGVDYSGVLRSEMREATLALQIYVRQKLQTLADLKIECNAQTVRHPGVSCPAEYR